MSRSSRSAARDVPVSPWDDLIACTGDQAVENVGRMRPNWRNFTENDLIAEFDSRTADGLFPAVLVGPVDAVPFLFSFSGRLGSGHDERS